MKFLYRNMLRKSLKISCQNMMTWKSCNFNEIIHILCIDSSLSKLWPSWGNVGLKLEDSIFYNGKKVNYSKKLNWLLSPHLYMLLIFSCLDCGHMTIFGPTMGVKFDVSLKIWSWELQYSIYGIAMKLFCNKRGSM